jgi:chromosome segregation protein
MHITKLRLLGFKSFVEPTELLIEPGLTGVVGPNGCGKSNLLEALRWAMGETSYKSMRAASMDEVIFNGTTLRPARNLAEVTMFIDNAARRAPVEFNDHDVLEITRRIEREMGSAYRVNGRETRARDIKILFEDAATGARSPALVRQGQIAEIVNAKPEQRRRILEDAAGVAGLHSRRHEADLRLKAAEANLARVSDVLGQLNTQLESLKRQARHARRYKDLSDEIRRAEAMLHHLQWLAIEADITREEAALAVALSGVAAATALEAHGVVQELAAAERLPEVREVDARAAAALQRIRIEQETFEKEAVRAARRHQELQDRSQQFRRDLQREVQLVVDAREQLAQLTRERQDLVNADALAVRLEAKANAAFASAEAAARNLEQRLSGLQTAAAEARARRKSLDAQAIERAETVAKLERQLSVLAAQALDVTQAAPDQQALALAADRAADLTAAASDLEAQSLTADTTVGTASFAAAAARTAAGDATLAAAQLTAEVETLTKLLKPAGNAAHPPAMDLVTVEPGYEMAMAAALGEDLDAPMAETEASHWRLSPCHPDDPPLPPGVVPLATFVAAPPELARRLAQIGLVTLPEAARLQSVLKPGQRLVTRAGDLWRWDGFVAGHQGAIAARRLTERNRLSGLVVQQAAANRRAIDLTDAATKAVARQMAATATERRLRAEARDALQQLAATRESLADLEQQARDSAQRTSALTDASDAARAALVEATARRADVTVALDQLGPADPFEAQLQSAQDDAIEKRQAVADARAERATLVRDQLQRTERLRTLAGDLERCQARIVAADAQQADIHERIAQAEDELLIAAELPDQIEDQRQGLLSASADAEQARRVAADTLAEADSAFRHIQTQLRAAQAAAAQAREAKARLEARLEGVRQKRVDHVRKCQDAVGVLPPGCLALAEHPTDTPLPNLDDVERTVARAKADRERLGGVNLAADDDLAKAMEQFGGLDQERQDVENAIAKLRGAIAELNRDARGRLNAAFETVNGHFQKLFGVLFGGGDARLEMLESDTDPLAGGLEIFAKPPGKKPATLSLLSGGEQTLTALSLIFAVFLTNPSPICVLDEVDAPLDDANVDRFCTMMERMAADTATRFLVITHHPMTMARMNRLFGVTMAEKGVSQLVSVDLEAARQIIDDEVAA